MRKTRIICSYRKLFGGRPRSVYMNVAGVAGLEPAVPLLESGGLPLTDTPRKLGSFYQKKDII